MSTINMTSIEFINVLNEAKFTAYPRKVELTVADLTNVGLTPEASAVTALNALIAKASRNPVMSYQTTDLPERTFIDRGNWVQGKAMLPQKEQQIA